MKPLGVLILLALIRLCAAASCNHDDVLRGLLQRSTDASSFCATYLGHSSLSASVILCDITIVRGTYTETYGLTETATLFQAFSKTTSKKTVTTSYSSQVPARAASSILFSIPTPASYVATYPVSRISSACSCLSVSVQNIPVNVNCDNVPNNDHIKVTNIDTVITSTQIVKLPFPTTCPDMAQAEYIGADGSPWSRSCSDSWGGSSSTLSSGTATSLDNCIDQCVANNQRVKYVQCVAVEFDPTTSNTCDLLSFVTFPNRSGVKEIAGLNFYEAPFPTLPPGFCESAASSFLATASPP